MRIKAVNDKITAEYNNSFHIIKVFKTLKASMIS